MHRLQSISQTKAKISKQIIVDHVDLVIAAATWDRRCLTISELAYRERPDRALLLRFKDKGSSGAVERHEGLLLEELSSITGGLVSRMDVDVDDLKSAWASFRRFMLEAYRTNGRPLKVVLDLNSVPRYLALSLFGLAWRSGVCSDITAVYSAAKTYQHESPGQFTAGQWMPMAIPTLGEGAPASSRSHLIVSAGFEGDHTRRLVSALEPDQLSIVLTAGIGADHEMVARQANSALAAEYLLGKNDIVWLPAGDVGAALASLRTHLRASGQRDDHSTVAHSFLLSGSKLASLAVALYSLEEEVAQVYYSAPDARLEAGAAEIEWITAVKVLF